MGSINVFFPRIGRLDISKVDKDANDGGAKVEETDTDTNTDTNTGTGRELTTQNIMMCAQRL